MCVSGCVSLRVLQREEVRNRKLLGFWAWPGGEVGLGAEIPSETREEVKIIKGLFVCLFVSVSVSNVPMEIT